MSNYKVNGKATSRPAGYDSFDESKRVVNRTTQLQHGKEERGFDAPKHEKVGIGELFTAIREYKEQGKPLQNVVRIKAQNVVQENER